MANYAVCVLFLVIVVAVTQAYSNRGLNNEFYKELQHLLARKSITDELNSDSSYDINIEKQKLEVPEEVRNWPTVALNVGQISGVSVDPLGHPVIFHRGSRIWDEWSFNITDNFLQVEEGPIQENTILILDPETGKILKEWGSNMFYMPHGLTIDRHNYYWVTDVALHQVFKFKLGDPEPILTFGVRFHPGSSTRHLCKPTSVAVATTGEVFIADGYCNHRILKYNAAGGLLRIFPSPPEFLSLQVPHSLVLMEQWDRICVADRENMRVACPRVGLYSNFKEPATTLTIQEPDLGRVFAIAGKGDLLYAVNGPTSKMIPVQGFTIDPRSETIIDHWAPISGKFANPHTIAVSPDGFHLYVGEISPNRLWKFNLIPVSNKIMKK